MIFQELRRVLLSKYVLFSIVFILLLSTGLNGAFIEKANNTDQILKGEAQASGEITEDKLLDALIKVRDKGSTNPGDQYLVTLISGLVYNYPGILYTEHNLEKYPDEYGSSFYQCWRNKSLEIISRLPEEDHKPALNKLEEVKTPFHLYKGYYYWNTLLDNLKTIFMIIIFLACYLASSIYSDSIENGSMEIIKSTKYGKRALGLRLLPVALYGIILILVAVLQGVIHTGAITGYEALSSSFKGLSLFSLGNFTIGQALMIMCGAEILGILATTTIMGFISFITGKTGLTTAIGIGINIFYIIISFFIGVPFKFIQLIINALPMASSHVIGTMTGYQFDFGLWRPYEIIVSMVVVTVISAGMLLSAIRDSEK